MMEGTKQAKPGASQLSRAAETKQESKERVFSGRRDAGVLRTLFRRRYTSVFKSSYGECLI